MGRVQESLEETERAYRLDALDPGFANQLALARMAAGRVAEAVPVYEDLVARVPDMSFPVSSLLRAYAFLQDWAAVDRLWDECRRTGRLDDPLVRQQLARCRADAVLFGLHTAGDTDPSLVKLFWAEVTQRLYEVATDVLGPEVLVDGGPWAAGLLSTRANSIQGGTSEIQRNVIGERLLGLPR